MIDFKPLFPSWPTPQAPDLTPDIANRSRVTILGTMHVNTSAEIRNALDSRFSSNASLPPHIAVELDSRRFLEVVERHGLAGFAGQAVFHAPDPQTAHLGRRDLRSQVLAWGMMKAMAANEAVQARLRGVKRANDFALGAGLALAAGKKLYLVDRDTRVIFQYLAEMKSGRRDATTNDLLLGATTLSITDRNPKLSISTAQKYFPTPSDAKTYWALTKDESRLQRDPAVYNAMIRDRNIFMVENVFKITRQNPGQNVLLIVGAQHTVGMLEIFTASGEVDVEVIYAGGDKICSELPSAALQRRVRTLHERN